MPQENGLKCVAEARKDMFLIPLKNLKIEEGFNVREDYGDMDELAKSIAENGQIQPLTVRSGESGDVIIIDGHRRKRAFDLANEKYGAEIKSAWCIPENKGANEETRIIDLLLSNSGKPLTTIEQASVIKRLVGLNWKIGEISKRIGKSLTYVNNILALHSASKEVREIVRDGIISPTAGVKLAQAPMDKQNLVLQKIKTLCEDPTGENKNKESERKTGELPEKKGAILKVKSEKETLLKDKSEVKKRRVSVAEIEKEVKGENAMISIKGIKDLIKEVEGIIAEYTERTIEGDAVRDRWEAVKYGLELAAGKKELEPNKFS